MNVLPSSSAFGGIGRAPFVTYWTAQWNPSREAVSKEVAQLRSALSPDSPVVCFGSSQRTAVRARERVLQLGAKRWLLLRGLAALIEPRGDITHVVGDGSWHLLRAVGRRPVVFTLMIPGALPSADLLNRVSVFVAESEPLAETLRARGVEPHRLQIVYPGVDLMRFRVRPVPSGRFRLVFASTPAHVHEFADRGIPLMIDLARRRPDIDLLLLWREWGSRSAVAAALQALDPPPNVIVERSDVSDMSEAYARAHATICCFAEGTGKSCPNSVIEGLAVGRPALVSKGCGIASLMERAGAGVACERTADALAEGVDTLRAARDAFAEGARRASENYFDERKFIQQYDEIYRRLRA